MKELLGWGASVKDKDKEGFTALCWAAKYGADDAVRALLDGGADVNAANMGGFTPLQLATLANQTDTVRLLLDRGASATVKNSAGESAWTFARVRSIRIMRMVASAVQAEPDSSAAASLSPTATSPAGAFQPASVLERTLSASRTTFGKASGPSGGPRLERVASQNDHSLTPSYNDVVSHLDSVWGACGLGGFTLTVTWPGEKEGTEGRAVDATPTINQLASTLHSLALRDLAAYDEFVSDTEAHRSRALEAAQSEEQHLAAQRAALAITRQRSKAAHSVEDAQFDLEEAQIHYESARKAAQACAAGSEAARSAQEEAESKAAWVERKKAGLEAAKIQLAAAEKL